MQRTVACIGSAGGEELDMSPGRELAPLRACPVSRSTCQPLSSVSFGSATDRAPVLEDVVMVGDQPRLRARVGGEKRFRLP